MTQPSAWLKRGLRPVVHAGRRARSAAQDGIAAFRRAPETDGVSAELLRSEPLRQRGQRHFGPDELATLTRIFAAADHVVPLREAALPSAPAAGRVVALRHDLDHDIENAVRFAHWEADRGVRSTYFVLHSEWYWGRRGPGAPSAYVLRGLDEIASLGHEIGVHNNAVAEALRTGRQPAAILGEALAALRSHGFDVVGTAGHGDPIARRLGFLNQEMFAECPDADGRDPRRRLEWYDARRATRRVVVLDPVPMASLGLAYEAYSIGHTRYLSEAEGRWNVDPAGLAADFERETGLLQILTHPVHWALSGEPTA